MTLRTPLPAPSRAHPRRGFTLIELLTVIAIIAVLAGILFPVFAQVQKGSKKAACMSNLHQIVQAVKMYRDDHRVYPDALYGIQIGNTPFGLRLGQDYVKDPGVFTCPLHPQQLKSSTTVVQPTNPMTGLPYQVFAGGQLQNAGFQLRDSYDFQLRPAVQNASIRELHYKRWWTEIPGRRPGVGDDKRQLIYREPPDDTIVTWCMYHSDMDTTGKPAKGGIAMVAYLSGRVQSIPADRFITWDSPTLGNCLNTKNCPWQQAPKP